MWQEILQNAAAFSLQNVTRVTLFITNYNDQVLHLKKIKIIEILRIYLKKLKNLKSFTTKKNLQNVKTILKLRRK